MGYASRGQAERHKRHFVRATVRFKRTEHCVLGIGESEITYRNLRLAFLSGKAQRTTRNV